MDSVTLDKLNTDAMQIILHAGDARKLMQQAIDAICDDKGMDEANRLLKEAKHELLEAHNIQTDDIQQSVTQTDQVTCLLFTHAQDTLMTINSEMLMVKSMIKLYEKGKGA